MLNTFNANANADQAAYDRIRDTETHLRRHGRGLCDLLDALDAPGGFDALCELHGFFGTQHPNADEIAEALAEIERALEAQTASAADRIARDYCFDASSAIRWHGARISELRRRFQDAK
ncbi:hypothetical protein [Pseudooceanicola sp.]|uniref:hypothetical protein n=1 Tax=Pseudooceanicola sp. TaxID=1914328 RepID=UPI0035C707C9